MASIPSYRAEMIGLSDRDRMLLRSLLAATQARTGVRWDGDAAQPAVQFVDVDGQAGAEFWQSVGDGHRESIIVLASTAPAGAVRWLPKPLRSTSLLDVLQQMTLPARPPAPLAAVTTLSAQSRSNALPAEPASLLDVLEGAPAPTARVVQSPHWPDIVIASGNTHAMRIAPMETYAEGFAASLELSRVAKYTGGPINDDQRVDVETLRWLALLYAPIGEIATRLPYPQRARLRKPPAFGHLPHKLHHVRMAAWLSQHPSAPRDVAEMMGIDEETVQRFLGACAALGLLEEIVETRAEPVAAPPAVMAPASAATLPAEAFVPARSMPAAAHPARDLAEPADAVVSATADLPAGELAPAARESTVEAAAPVAETGSVLERLRATREQNRARVAAAIRNVRGAGASPPSASAPSAAAADSPAHALDAVAANAIP